MAFDRYVMYEPVALKRPCSDVRDVDVSNMTFRVRDPAWRGQTEYSFRNGRAEPEVRWTATIDHDKWATTSDGAVLRVVSIADSHGTGEWKFVSVLSCQDGSLREVLQAGGEGLGPDVRRISDGTLRLSWLIWRRGDCHACPSRERMQTLSWRPSYGRFAIVGDIERAFKPRSDP